jgi:hypothetical protein
MRKVAYTILGALLIAGSAVQMATASELHPRTGRSYRQWDYRGSYNQLKEPFYAAPRTLDGNNQGGLSKPAPNETRSCDNIWCYAN